MRAHKAGDAESAVLEALSAQCNSQSLTTTARFRRVWVVVSFQKKGLKVFSYTHKPIDRLTGLLIVSQTIVTAKLGSPVSERPFSHKSW